MTSTAELITGVDTVRSGMADARAQTGQALECANELRESAAAHGWEGIVASVQAVSDALEAVAASLDTAEQAGGTVLAALQAITEQMSSPEVAERLAGVVAELDQAGEALDAAIDSADEAWQAGQRAGEPRELMDLLQGVVDGLDEARRGVADVKDRADAERMAAASWGN